MKNHDDVLYRAIRSMYYTIVTDEKGNVICLSKNYEDLLDVRGEDYIGKSVQNLIENSEITPCNSDQKGRNRTFIYLEKWIDRCL